MVTVQWKSTQALKQRNKLLNMSLNRLWVFSAACLLQNSACSGQDALKVDLM